MNTNRADRTRPRLRLVGSDRSWGFEPYDLQVVIPRGRTLDSAILLERDAVNARQPELIDRSVLTTDVMDGYWSSPMTPRWYYLLTLQSVLEVRRTVGTLPPTIGWIVECLRTSPPEPARPGELQLATPTELLLVTGDWSMDEGIVYRRFMPVLALGGCSFVQRSAGRKNVERATTPARLELRSFDSRECTVLTVMDDDRIRDSESGSILVRSRCNLEMRSVVQRSR